MVKAIVTFTLGVIAIATSLASDISECPEQCQCKRTNQTNQVTCVNQSLDRIPDNIPATVTLLDLHGNNLSSPTNVFQHLTQVQRLDLSFNNLNIIYPWDFKNSNLECLNLSNNHITVLQDVFQALTRLEVLNISNNSITTLNSSAFEGLSNLHILDLQQNRISDISSDAFMSLQSLTQIDLRNNNIKELPEKLFRNLTNLQEISLGNNLLTKLNLRSDSVTTLLLPNNSICEISMLDLPKLEVLDLSWNNLTSLPTDFFENVQNLSTLILDGNPIHFINQAVFKTLSKLQILSMKMMPQLSYLSKETFLGLETLEVLELCNNPHLSFIAKELFIPLSSLQILDLSFNALQSVYNESISELTELKHIDFSGNNFTCDCAIEWLIENIQSNSSIIVNSDELKCSLLGSKEKLPLLNISIELLHCSDVRIVNYSADSSFRIGKPAILHCYAESTPIAEITWITPRKKVLKYHNAHHLVHMNYLPFEDHNKLIQAIDDVDKSYYSESETRDDRIRILSDGSLFIEFVMRGDAGKYKCIAENPRNSTEVEILVKLDYAVLNEVKIWSLVVGFSCAGSFFLLNLTYSLTLAAVRRCVSQRRRQQIREIIESMDHYKTAHLSRIKENYNHQVGRIRDQYHYQLGRLREHHHTQMSRMGRMREGASQKVEKIRDNYNNQLGRLKDYSSTQLVQLRGKYNNQVDKIKDFGNDKLDRLHEKYKLKQQHVLKLLDMMNFDNCRTAFESECTRTESMILHSEVFTTDVPLHSPIDSISPSDSEYVTATSSKVTSKCASREKLNREFTDCDTGESNSEFSGPINPYLPDDCSENETHTLASTGSFYDTQLNEEVTSAAGMTNETPLYNRDEQRKLNMDTSSEESKSLKFITCDKENTYKIQLESFVMERGNTDETKTAKAESLPLLTHSTKQPEAEVNTNNSIKSDIHNGGKSSATNTHTVGHSKDISIDMSDEGHGWTIRESVV